MIFDELKALIELYEKCQTYKTNSQQQKMFDLTLINLYKLGNNGKTGIIEHSLNDIQGISKMELFKSLKEAEQEGLIDDITSHDHRQWILTLDGIMYTEALLERIKK